MRQGLIDAAGRAAVNDDLVDLLEVQWVAPQRQQLAGGAAPLEAR